GGGAGGAYNGTAGTNRGGKGGSGAVILRVRSAPRVCTLQPSRGKDNYPMGLRSPYLDEGMSLFTFSYQNADTNCAVLVQIATNMTPAVGSGTYVPGLTESLATNDEDVVWTTLERYDFRTMTPNQRAGGTLTTFISLRQHWIYDIDQRKSVYTNVCGVIRVIVDPDIVSNVVNTTGRAARDAKVDYGKITITKAYCYNEPALNLKSWFGWNVHTEGWDGAGNPGDYAYLTDWPDGLSIALNFSSKENENNSADAKGIGLGEPDKATEYAGQNPFIQSAALTNGIGSVSFRARLFDTNQTPAVVTLYGGLNPSDDQVNTESATWIILTNFVVTTPTYQAFEWAPKAASSPYQAVRLEAAGARWGRYPSHSSSVADWEWGNITPKQQPVNRVFIDEVSASELIVPRLKFLEVRPFREHLGSEDICVITNIMKADQQPLIQESWGIQCRLEPQQMADELDTSTIRVWMEVYRGKTPWGYEQWKNIEPDNATRFSSELQRVSDSNLVFRSYYLFPGSIIPPEETPNTVYQYVVRATYRDKSGSTTEYPAVLESADWVKPEWYRGSDVGSANDSGDPSQFSAFTILDSISPRRAWINEINVCDYSQNQNNGPNQFLEFAVPQNANLRGWKIMVSDYNGNIGSLATFGIDDGVRDILSKTGSQFGVDITNHYTFVSVCAPASSKNVPKYDGYWKKVSMTGVISGVFQRQYPFGIQLVRPSGIVEHEVVMQGTNTLGGVWGVGYTGTNLVNKLKAADPESTWFYAGEDLQEPGSSLGVWRSHGEDETCWTNYMTCTSAEINKMKNGKLQEVPEGYFLEPFGGNVWIYSTLLQPDLSKQFYGGRDMGTSAVIVVPEGTSTNIVLQVTNWYQLGSCTINGTEVPDARGHTGLYSLNLGSVSNTLDIKIDVEQDNTLANEWGLTPENTYSSAVLAWLHNEYPGYDPGDLSQAIYRDLSGTSKIPLTLTEMYWLNIPPVHAAPVYGGSNIWFVAGAGAQVSSGEPSIEPYGKVMNDGTTLTNVYMTVTMMITNTSPLAAAPRVWPPDRLNGHVYDGLGSSELTSAQNWTSAVFIVTGALQKPDAAGDYLPLQQYTLKPGSFGAADSAHPFQTRVDIVDPFSPNSMGYHYGWIPYRNVYNVWYRWIIKPNPQDYRLSTVPLVPSWDDDAPHLSDP
ncbi:MAG: hypothetical protein IJJ84_03865, partial [Kiritimatiellae bacterium]|nr:hypothetical protein [Kiritimatiellia bacterium]